MSQFSTDPLTFTAARDFLAQKAVLPTGLSSREISNATPAAIRNQAFLSARVASAHILESLKAEVEKIARGDTDYVSARARLKQFLEREGYGVPGVGEKGERDVQTLGSTARLDLVLRQNVAMAHAVGQREVSENAAVREIYPNYKYIANTDRHRQFDGLVLPKDDPFWDTHYPPWEFNCQCIVVDTDEPANGRSAGFRTSEDGSQTGRLEFRGSAREVLPSESGYTFDSRPGQAFRDPDFDTIKDEVLREEFRKEWAARNRGQSEAS